MKWIVLFLLCLGNVYAGVVNLSQDKANEIIGQREKFLPKSF